MTKQYVYNIDNEQFELHELQDLNEEFQKRQKEIYENFEYIGIYGITIQYPTVVKYRYVYTYPSIPNKEFQKIVDDIIKNVSDIDFIVRELEKIGFKKLKSVSELNYNFGSVLNCK